MLQGSLKHTARSPVSAAASLGSALLYGAAAVSMNFINKLTLQVFGLVNTLLLLQMSAVVLVVAALRVHSPPSPQSYASCPTMFVTDMLCQGIKSTNYLLWIDALCQAQAGNLVHFPALHLQRAWTLAPVTLLYVSNVAFALMGLQNLNIPMYNTLKRLTPVIVLFTRVRIISILNPAFFR